MCWIIRDFNPSRDKSYICSPKVQIFRRVPQTGLKWVPVCVWDWKDQVWSVQLTNYLQVVYILREEAHLRSTIFLWHTGRIERIERKSPKLYYSQKCQTLLLVKLLLCIIRKTVTLCYMLNCHPETYVNLPLCTIINLPLCTIRTTATLFYK